MKKSYIILVISVCLVSFLAEDAYSFWIWTPKTKKLVNPKHAAKDTPEEQFKWAMKFYEEKNYKRSTEEFERLTKAFQDSDLAPEAQYYAGKSLETLGKPFPAFTAYQKVVDSYPFTKRIDEIIEREYDIGQIMYEKHVATLMGIELMTDLERAIEIFKKVRDNAPFGSYADKAQFMMGQCYKKSEQYGEAIGAFQRVIDEYPKSNLFDKARYEVAQCTYLASLKPDYDQELTDEAIKEFKAIAETREGLGISEDARAAVKQLENRKAESIFKTAEFYSRNKHYVSAIMYYEEIIDKYPESPLADIAAKKIEKFTTFADKEKEKIAEQEKRSKKKKKWIFF